jgi:hypothetical protein
LQKSFPDRLAETLAIGAPGTPIEVWFQDEMRLGQNNKITWRWARRGTTPRALADLRTKSAYLFGAICPARGTGAAIVMPHANSQALPHHLDKIARLVRPRAAPGRML